MLDPLIEEDKETGMYDAANRAEIKSSRSDSAKQFPQKMKKPPQIKSSKSSDKTRIDSLQDLNKLTFTQIKALQIWNLEGKLFQQAFQDAMHVKKSEKLIKHSISSIELQVHYKTDVCNGNINCG